MSEITVGRLLRANTRGCVVGCHISQSPPPLGAMVYIPLENRKIFGIVYDIHIDDDGLVRQLAASDTITEEVIQDNRLNRNTPIEMSIIFIGNQFDNAISHLLPSTPPLSLDKMYLCGNEHILDFIRSGKYGYFRYFIAEQNAPIPDLFTAHFHAVYKALPVSEREQWKECAITAVIALLQDNHILLANVLGAIGDAFPGIGEG